MTTAAARPPEYPLEARVRRHAVARAAERYAVRLSAVDYALACDQIRRRIATHLEHWAYDGSDLWLIETLDGREMVALWRGGVIRTFLPPRARQ